MATWRYVSDALDEKYSGGPIPSMASCEDLPPEDFEVRKELAQYKATLLFAADLGFFEAFFKTKKARAMQENVRIRHDTLMALVNKSQEHKAAIRRIVNDMPRWLNGHEEFAKFLK